MPPCNHSNPILKLAKIIEPDNAYFINKNLKPTIISAFPNPFSDFITIILNSDKKFSYDDLRVIIFDNIGKKVINKSVQHKQNSLGIREIIKIIDLPNGNYHATLSNKKGILYTTKFIKK